MLDLLLGLLKLDWLCRRCRVGVELSWFERVARVVSLSMAIGNWAVFLSISNFWMTGTRCSRPVEND